VYAVKKRASTSFETIHLTCSVVAANKRLPSTAARRSARAASSRKNCCGTKRAPYRGGEAATVPMTHQRRSMASRSAGGLPVERRIVRIAVVLTFAKSFGGMLTGRRDDPRDHRKTTAVPTIQKMPPAYSPVVNCANPIGMNAAGVARR
jgi:hypothetical protein